MYTYIYIIVHVCIYRYIRMIIRVGSYVSVHAYVCYMCTYVYMYFLCTDVYAKCIMYNA